MLRVSQVLGYLGEACFRRGSLDEAISLTSLAVEAAEDGGRVWDFPILHTLASYPRSARAEWKAAEAHVSAAAQIAQFFEEGVITAYSVAAGYLLASARGDVCRFDARTRTVR